ncbi:MAG: alpha-2-macroglobulin family protein, partial [Patescibacteria group bacterium]
DVNGDGDYQFTAGGTGEYEFTVIGTDELGNSVSAQYDFYVSGHGAISIRPTNNATLELVAEKTNLAVGESGSFVIKSPYLNAKALVTLARGNTYEHKVLDINSHLTKYQFAATEQYIPNVVASVLLLSPRPEIKYGEVYYAVGTDEKKLAITITPGKKSYLPGEKVKLGIEVKNSKGNPVRAELSLSVVDMSVLALVGNTKKNPVTFFYNGEPLTIRTAINVKNVLNVAEIPVGTKGGAGGGGDDLEKQKRGLFRDTAYWEGAIETDANGKANVEFTLPDNLTEWQVESVGITENTKIGAGYGDFTARKSVMVTPLKPRFILPGDSFAVGGMVFNETDITQKLKVSVAASTLTFTGKTETTVVIEPHTSVSVSFPAIATESTVSGEHVFTLAAKNNNYEDVVSSSFPIERNDTYEFTATAGHVTDPSFREQLYLPNNIVPDRGSLTVSLSATMASVLDSAIHGMIVYPYEGSEQVASKLRTIAVVKQNAWLFGATAPMLPEKVTIGDQTFTIDQIVQNGLAKLYQNQTPDGGMPYYANLPPDFRVTLATLETYIDLKKAGYAVDENKMKQTAQYIYNYINYPRADYRLTSEDIITGSYVLSKLTIGALESPAIRAKLIGYASDGALVRGLSTPALAYLAIFSAQEQFSTE